MALFWFAKWRWPSPPLFTGVIFGWHFHPKVITLESCELGYLSLVSYNGRVNDSSLILAPGALITENARSQEQAVQAVTFTLRLLIEKHCFCWCVIEKHCVLVSLHVQCTRMVRPTSRWSPPTKKWVAVHRKLTMISVKGKLFLLLVIVTIILNCMYFTLFRVKTAPNGADFTTRANESLGLQYRGEPRAAEARGTPPSRRPGTTAAWPWCSGRSPPFNRHRSRKESSSDRSQKQSSVNKFFLSAVLVVRIYASDTNRLTVSELVQWLQYLSWAGVDHVYLYDSYHDKSESQRENLRCFIRNGFVSYIDWSHRVKRNITGLQRAQLTQQPAYQNCLNRYGNEFTWQTAIDIDEYPYSSLDRAPGFLRRVVRKVAREQGPNVGQMFMKNYLFLGEPLNARQHPLLIERLWWRTKEAWDYTTRKPIYLSRAVHRANVHDNRLRPGFGRYFPDVQLLRMNHYHGARHKTLSKEAIQKMTRKDLGMTTAVSAMRLCLDACYLGCC